LNGPIYQGHFKKKAVQADKEVKGSGELKASGYARIARKEYEVSQNERGTYYGLVSQHSISIFNAIST
jgi:L-amino acid N-acyltransferase YncA